MQAQIKVTQGGQSLIERSYSNELIAKHAIDGVGIDKGGKYKYQLWVNCPDFGWQIKVQKFTNILTII